MDCNVFRKKLRDLIEENIEFDLKEAMLNHIEKCEVCRSIYKEELAVEESFKAAFSIDTGNFRSLRPEIMKNIDKNRYGKSPVKRFLNHLKKYKANYSALAAVTATLVFITPYIAKDGVGFGAAKKAAPEAAMQAADFTKNKSSRFVDEKKSIGNNDKSEMYAVQGTEITDTVRKDLDYLPKFERKDLSKEFKVEFSIPWETSPSGKYSAAVEGIGENAQEEGIGIIVVKDEAGKQWSFSLLDNEQNQYTPKKLKWVDDGNLLMTVGSGYGTVNIGGELYILNIQTNTVTKPSPNNIEAGAHSEITNILSVEKIENNKLRVYAELIIYEDASLNANHRENATIITNTLSK
jgi:hypothetical protein